MASGRPGIVQVRIANPGGNRDAEPGRQDRLRVRRRRWWPIARQIEAGLDPDAVAARVLAAIRNDELYIFTHPGMRTEVEGRFASILAAMDAVSPP
jgi:hypothetical protein